MEILIDLGSTHNLLDPLVVEAANLKMLQDSRLHVKVANDGKILSQGRCEETIGIQETRILVPFHVLTLGGCDIVLGVQGLKTLGPINLDFTNMSTKFMVEEKKLSLQGCIVNG